MALTLVRRSRLARAALRFVSTAFSSSSLASPLADLTIAFGFFVANGLPYSG